jgi:hypothetical protein
MSAPAVSLRCLCARACTPTCTFHMPHPHLPLFDRPSYAMPCVRRARYRCTDYDRPPFLTALAARTVDICSGLPARMRRCHLETYSGVRLLLHTRVGADTQNG